MTESGRQLLPRLDCPECGSDMTVRVANGVLVRGKTRDTWKCTDCNHEYEVIRHG